MDEPGKRIADLLESIEKRFDEIGKRFDRVDDRCDRMIELCHRLEMNLELIHAEISEHYL